MIACIGELLEEREAGKTFDVCYQQLKAFAGNLSFWLAHCVKVFFKMKFDVKEE